MPRFEDLRDRLPSLYRPDDDETVGPLVPLGRDDLAELSGDGGAVRFTSTQRDGSLVVTLHGAVVGAAAALHARTRARRRLRDRAANARPRGLALAEAVRGPAGARQRRGARDDDACRRRSRFS